jgi:hypothetical protein
MKSRPAHRKHKDGGAINFARFLSLFVHSTADSAYEVQQGTTLLVRTTSDIIFALFLQLMLRD